LHFDVLMPPKAKSVLVAKAIQKGSGRPSAATAVKAATAALLAHPRQRDSPPNPPPFQEQEWSPAPSELIKLLPQTIV